MRQFDVYENPSPRRRDVAPYFVLLSSHLLRNLDEVVVAPLVLERDVAIGDIEVRLEFEGRTHVLMVPGLFSLPSRELKRHIGSLADREEEIRRALNRLFTGF